MRLLRNIGWLSLVVLTMASCNRHEQAFSKQGLVYCSEGNPESFNPQLVTSGTSFDASANVLYNRLVQYSADHANIEPSLAERFTISPDGKTYTFYLRHGVKFHTTDYFKPSRDMNADDVIFTFQRQWLLNHPYYKVSGGRYPYFQSMALQRLITRIEKLDDYTVQFTLEHPESPFLATLTMGFASILSEEYASLMMARNTPEKFDQLPIGTGPFKFRAYQRDAFIRYLAHPDYWRGKEKISMLVFAITPDPSQRYARLRTQECHVIAHPLPAHLKLMKKDPNLVVYQKTGLNIGYWAFNTRKPPLDNMLVRQALNHAIDREFIIDSVYDNLAKVAKSPVPPSSWAHHADLQDYAYDPEKAKALLKQAGLEQGFTIDIWAMPVQRAYNPNARKMAELIQQDLRKIGVEAKIVSYDWGTFLTKVRNGEHQTALLGWTADNADPDDFLTPLLSCDAAKQGNNRAFWCDAEFDQLIAAARKTPDKEERTRLYRTAQELFKAKAPWLTIAHANQYEVALKSVKGLSILPSGGIIFSGVYRE